MLGTCRQGRAARAARRVARGRWRRRCWGRSRFAVRAGGRAGLADARRDGARQPDRPSRKIGSHADDAVSAEEREALEGWSRALSPGQLHRLWQLLLKGYEEVRSAPDPLVAAQHGAAAGDARGRHARSRRTRAAAGGGGGGRARGAWSAPSAPALQPPVPPRAAELGPQLADQVEGRGQLHLPTGHARLDPRRLAAARRAALRPGARLLGRSLGRAARGAAARSTGERWLVERVVAEGGEPSAARACRGALPSEKPRPRCAAIRWSPRRSPPFPMPRSSSRPGDERRRHHIIGAGSRMARPSPQSIPIGTEPMESMEEMIKAAQAAAETIQKQMNETQRQARQRLRSRVSRAAAWSRSSARARAA